MKSVISVVLATCLAVASANIIPGPVKYHGDPVLRVNPTMQEHHDWMSSLYLDGGYDFWSAPKGVGKPVDVHVPKTLMDEFQNMCKGMNLNYTVQVPDLQKMIDEVEASVHHRERRQAETGEKAKDILNTFARFDDISAWVYDMCDKHSDLAECGVIGTSYEGREIPYIKMGKEGAGKREIFLQGGIHAREWLSPATSVYLINRFLTTYSTAADAKRLLDKYVIYFAPSVNPDGYEYTRQDRMWRKTRSNYNTRCTGVDPNRNYDVAWATSGSSNSPCSDIYHGPHAFSEKETKALSEFIASRGDKMLAYFDIHCYSQVWLIPYADKRGHYAPNFDELLRVANIGTNALMAVNNMEWEAGNTVEVLSAAAGGSEDWAVDNGVKYGYTLELRPHSRAMNGFVVAESEIDPSGREVWAGLVAAIDAMKP